MTRRLLSVSAALTLCGASLSPFVPGALGVGAFAALVIGAGCSATPDDIPLDDTGPDGTVVPGPEVHDAGSDLSEPHDGFDPADTVDPDAAETVFDTAPDTTPDTALDSQDTGDADDSPDSGEDDADGDDVPDVPVDPCVSMVCDDENLCTDDSCDAGSCVFTPNAAACDDEDPCTVGDICAEATCAGVPKPCDDGDACTADGCDAGDCTHVVTDGLPCEDGQLCLSGDTCVDGACVGGITPKCNDANQCTADSCDEATGVCSNIPHFGSCEDGVPCTVTGLCVDGVCKPGPVYSCDDNNPCTIDTCTNTESGCANLPVDSGTCDDGDPCTIDDACVGAECIGEPKSCEDGDPCTDAEFCDVGTCLPGIPVECDDGNPCTEDSCDPETGECVAEPSDDGQVCNDPAWCDSGLCQAGVCVVETGTSCADDDICTVDTCTEAGCLFPYVKCPAAAHGCVSNKCITEDGGCTPFPLNSQCEDGIACTLNTCGVDGGCAYEYPPGCCDARPLETSFEGSIDGWTATTLKQTVGWQYWEPPTTWSGKGVLYYGSVTDFHFDTPGVANSGTVTSPEFVLPSGKNKLRVRFWVWHDVTMNPGQDQLELFIMPWGLKQWTLPSDAPPRSWKRYSVELEPFAGYSVALRFAFATGNSESNAGTGIFIDDIVVLGCD